MDLGTESGPRITTKAKAYIRYFGSGREQAESGVFPFVLWIAPDEDRAALLVDALARTPAEQWDLFRVATAASYVQLIANASNKPKEST
jgi:hypothetical protein